ncbi:arsenate reductase family protein [Aquimarina agarivorans]|uniref:arsenate reductase family protein n=1 Tax=Aquimarina agarivorans TaxID=980584 RepID=UPI000248FCA9|nr:ArsC/Spx/MgsR family protein [Aquimarina agarivorans]
MTKKVYYLATCSTCKRIIKELELSENFTLQNLKEQPIEKEELEKIYTFSGSYESLLNRRSVLYRERNLKEKQLTEEDCKNLILEHYSFLKRPIIQIGDHNFIGNAKKTVEAAKLHIENS